MLRLERPVASLLTLFIAWKVVLLTLAVLSPGAGYDTSTQLLFRGYGVDSTLPNKTSASALLAQKLTRWDAIYFASSAERGYQLEQEWAFSWGLTRAIAYLARRKSFLASTKHTLHHPCPVITILLANRGASLCGICLCESCIKTGRVSVNVLFLEERFLICDLHLHFSILYFINTRLPDVPLTKSTLLNTTYHGILLANISHLLSVFVLHRLALALPLGKKGNAPDFAFVAATLHILSPGGLFLSAPYAESTFSLLNFLGQLFFVSSYSSSSKSSDIRNNLFLILSGVCFGLSSAVRGNGLLSGILLLYDACLWAATVLNRIGIPILSSKIIPAIFRDAMQDFPSRRVPATIVAGLLVAIGFATPQYVAWGDYCIAGIANKRPWCDRIPPSIYSWVQKEYWLVKCTYLRADNQLTRAGVLDSWHIGQYRISHYSCSQRQCCTSWLVRPVWP